MGRPVVVRLAVGRVCAGRTVVGRGVRIRFSFLKELEIVLYFTFRAEL